MSKWATPYEFAKELRWTGFEGKDLNEHRDRDATFVRARDEQTARRVAEIINMGRPGTYPPGVNEALRALLTDLVGSAS